MLNQVVRSAFVALLLAGAPSLVGCSAPTDEDAASSEDAVRRPITLQNWQTHPKVQKSYEVVGQVNRDLANRSLTVASKENICVDGVGEARREIARVGAGGKVRRLVLEAGSDDGYNTVEAVYDARGTIRYVFAEANDVRGNSREDTLIFDDRGKLVFQVIRDANDPALDRNARPYRLPNPADQFDAFSFDDPRVLTAPAQVYERDPSCS